jgi:tetratricopeptide (TPR) repeat protein
MGGVHPDVAAAQRTEGPPMFTRMSRLLCSGCVLVAAALPLGGCETTVMMREKGLQAMQANDLPQAEHHLTRAVDKSPDDFLSQYYLGSLYLRQNQPLQAQLALERALTLRPQITPQTDDILDKLAEAMYQQGRYDSLHSFLASSASFYGRPIDYLRQARFLRMTGDVDQARVAYRKAAYFAPPGDATPYIAIAEFYESINNVPEAIRALQYAYWVDPRNPDAAAGLRRHGIVPGPTIAVEPPKPEMLR